MLPGKDRHLHSMNEPEREREKKTQTKNGREKLTSIVMEERQETQGKTDKYRDGGKAGNARMTDKYRDRGIHRAEMARTNRREGERRRRK